MATKRWVGGAVPFAQVTTITIADTWAGGDDATLTINGKDLTVTIGSSTTTSDVAEALAAAWNAADATTGIVDDETRNVGGQEIPEFREITATQSGAVITLTGNTKGKPFTVSVSEDTAGDGTVGTPSTTTAATGPNHWDNADNWDTGAVPVSTDDVYIENSSVDILYGIDANSVTLTSLHIAASFTGKIGLPLINADSASYPYEEYREDYLKISATTVEIGYGDGAGSGRIKLNVGSNQCTLTVDSTGEPAESGLAALLFVGTNASNAVYVNKGKVGIAQIAGEAATVATLAVGYVTSQASDSTVACGAGVTLTTVTQSGGKLTTRSAITTLNMRANSGEHHHYSGTITTLNQDGGTFFKRGAHTITTANLNSGAILDCRRSQAALTLTNTNLEPGSTIQDPNESITFSNAVAIPVGVKLDLGTRSHTIA